MRWLSLKDAAAYCSRSSPRLLYVAARDGRLRVARLGRGRSLVTSAEWCDEFLISLSKTAPTEAPTENRSTDQGVA